MRIEKTILSQIFRLCFTLGGNSGLVVASFWREATRHSLGGDVAWIGSGMGYAAARTGVVPPKLASPFMS
jgi:hypothetical protein